MTTVKETIPEGLRSDVEAALAWFNDAQEVAFEVTGIVDPEAALEVSGTRELRLVLCGGDRCEQRSFRVKANGDDYDVAFLDGDRPAVADGQVPAQLDPPPGARRGWLDRTIAQHAFVVLVFYRGYW